MKRSSRGFTLIELMIIIAIIGVLAAIAVTQYTSMIKKSQDGNARGNLGTIRSAIRIYFGDTQVYPEDDLTVLLTNANYLKEIPSLITAVHPTGTQVVTTELNPSEVMTWSYNNSPSVGVLGHVTVGCLHEDTRGSVWTTY